MLTHVARTERRRDRARAPDNGAGAAIEGTPGAVRRPPPRLGEHTREVLAGLVFTVAEIDAPVAGT